MDYEIFGFKPQNNSAFDSILDDLKEDANLCNNKPLEAERVSAVFNHLDKDLNDVSKSAFASLAVIGFVEYMLSKQCLPNDNQMVVFEKAISLDPIKDHSERVEVITSLTSQLRAYVNDL